MTYIADQNGVTHTVAGSLMSGSGVGAVLTYCFRTAMVGVGVTYANAFIGVFVSGAPTCISCIARCAQENQLAC